MTIGDLQKRERGGAMLKTVGDLVDGGSTPANESELLAMLDDVAKSHCDALDKLANVRSKMVAGMSPQSRAALQAMGQSLEKSLGRIEETNLDLQRRLNAARTSNGRQRIAKRGTSELEADVRRFREHTEAILSGRVVVSPDVRRDLAKALSRAEIALEEARR
jgi:hypothetical protein